MKIKNTYMSTIGFGHVTALPGEVVELPDGFNGQHPCIRFYLSRKWIEVVEDVPAVRKSLKTPKKPAAESSAAIEEGDAEKKADE